MALLFYPKYDFVQGKPLEIGLIKTFRNSKQVLELLGQAKTNGIELSIDSCLRGLDGCGSSLDLPEWQKKLTPLKAKDINNLPCTTVVSSNLETKIRFELSKYDAIEYIAPDYGISESKPIIVKENIILNNNDKAPQKQLDAPAYIFKNIFGLSGIKIVLEKISPLAVAGGMEASNNFNISLIAAASMLSGADLSLADIFSLAVKLENDEFGGLTGGQGHLSCILSGVYKHTWLSGIKDKSGNFLYPYSALSQSLLDKDKSFSLENHMAFVQAGKEFENGKQKINRTAGLINNMWTDLLRDEDEIGFLLCQKKVELSHKYASALKNLDFKEITNLLNEYADIRDQMCFRWIKLSLDAYKNKPVPKHAHKYKDKMFDKNHPDYKDYEVLRQIYQKQGDNLYNISVYSLGPISELRQSAKKQDIAIMPLGAGGPGSNLIAVSPKGLSHLSGFLQSFGLNEIKEESCHSIIRGTGILKGYLPFKVGNSPISFSGFEELGLALPSMPEYKDNFNIYGEHQEN